MSDYFENPVSRRVYQNISKGERFHHFGVITDKREDKNGRCYLIFGSKAEPKPKPNPAKKAISKKTTTTTKKKVK
tara:strand:- start:636 stop:860 length:225 start_codon:yes stop_codon:yes gene_type:complete